MLGLPMWPTFPGAAPRAQLIFGRSQMSNDDQARHGPVCDPPMVFTYGGMIAHVLTFAAHRRTLVCGALADAGITDLGAGDPMGWVAEHACPAS
jgi:hypothetical protein